MVVEESKVGRPTKYDPEYHPVKVLGYCLLGLTDEQIAGIFEIATSTFYEWKNDYPEFSESIKKGKEDADVKVAHSLFKRALGSKEKIQKWFKLKESINGEGSKETLEMREEEIYVPPEVSAQIFWLKNRNPGMWRDKKEIEVSEPDEITGVILSDDEDTE